MALASTISPTASLFTTTPTSNDTCPTLYAHRPYARVLMPLFYSVLFLVGLSGNALALHVIRPNRRKMNSTTLYSLNLVISDILFTLSVPFRLVYYALGFHWPLGEVMCKTLPLLKMEMTNVEPGGYVTCMEYPKFEQVEHIAYILIGAVVPGLRRAPGRGRSHKAIGVICCVSLVFVLCYSPYHLDLLQYMLRKLLQASPPDCAQLTAFQVSLHITVCLMNLNPCLDPFIYFFACRGYKRKVLKLLRRHVSASFSSVGRTSPEGSSRDIVNDNKIPLNSVHTSVHNSIHKVENNSVMGEREGEGARERDR
ncbi:unnamed protein product [Boreogadus saida]